MPTNLSTPTQTGKEAPILKPPKNSFSHVFSQLDAPPTDSTPENRMKWQKALLDFLKPISADIVAGVINVGKKAVDDAVDVFEDAGDKIKAELVGDLSLERLTFSYINELSPDDLQYLANKIAAVRDAVLRIESDIAAAAPLKYSKKVKTEMTVEQIDEVRMLIARQVSGDA